MLDRFSFLELAWKDAKYLFRENQAWMKLAVYSWQHCRHYDAFQRFELDLTHSEETWPVRRAYLAPATQGSFL